jgi:cation transport ATPase
MATTSTSIVEAVEHAEKARTPMQKTADRLAGYLVYFALGAAILTFLITRNVRSTISVVIVAGACGIAPGTPLAILGAIGCAARQGTIIKGGLYLVALATIDTVLLDKTGTLTFGTPQIREVISNDGFASNEIIAAAAIAERRSKHPWAKAIVARANELGMPIEEPDSFSYTPGRGIRVLIRATRFLSAVVLSSTLGDSEGNCQPMVSVEVAHPRYLWLASENCWGASALQMCYVPKQEQRWPRCMGWD